MGCDTGKQMHRDKGIWDAELFDYAGVYGDKGFFLMNDSWFAEYMFEIAVPKSYLPEDLQRALDLEPIVLPPWDPMGSLAASSDV